MHRLIDSFPSWMIQGNGIFYGMTGMPWSDDSDIDPAIMDFEYFGNRSGLKAASPILSKMTSFPDDIEVTQAEREKLQAIIKQKFFLSWQRIYDTLTAEYEPLENYEMEEIHTPGTTKKTAVEADNTMTNDGTGDVYGFNSSGASHLNKTGQTVRNTSDKSKNYTEESFTGHDTLTRHGNIGVTTSQQMAESELMLRKRHFLDIVYDDVDTILTCKTWGGYYV